MTEKASAEQVIREMIAMACPEASDQTVRETTAAVLEVGMHRTPTAEDAEIFRRRFAQELALVREPLAAKDRTIEIYQEMQRLQTAYEASERGRYQALQIATLVFAMLGQTQAKVTELKRRADVLRSLSARRPEENAPLERRLSRAQRQQAELSEQLLRAEQERGIAQQVADHAARRIQILEGELAELRFRMADDDLALPGSPDPQIPQHGLDGTGRDDATLEDVDRALEKVRAVLDEEHAAVQQAADDVGYRASADRMPPRR
ncbi:hypothetical protein ACH4TQ_44535 [Streptomyces sp. NPDC021218]|uniref:hypothetical protein n=1 Tax=Streptomyces sp. NPDC021218 TaxID=3365119 RepID=UPI0037BB544B